MRPPRGRREGELVAIAFNQKEQRVLEKSLATIRMETIYSMKLLDLSNRTVKVYFRQLREKVSRLKSHLTPDEIHELRDMEAAGKLGPMYPPVTLGSALKIAATNRRLNTTHSRYTTSGQAGMKSVPSRRQTDKQSPAPLVPSSGPLKRSNSVTGAFIDAPPSDTAVRPASASVAINRTSLQPHLPVDHKQDREERPISSGTKNNHHPDSKTTAITHHKSHNAESATTHDVQMPLENKQQHVHDENSIISKTQPHNADGVDDSKNTHNLRNVTYSSGQPQRDSAKSMYSQTPASPSPLKGRTSQVSIHAFSSHTTADNAGEGKDNRGGYRPSIVPTPRGRYCSADKTFILQDDSMDDLNESLYQERRAELLEEEQHRAAALTRRKDQFLKDMDQYIRDHSPPAPPTPMHRRMSRVTRKKSMPFGGDTQAEDDMFADQLRQLRRRKVESDLIPTHLPENEYRTRLMSLWTDMSKCRYLRLSDDVLDLSEVNTLATDTMKMYQVLKHRQGKPVCNAWSR